MQVNLWCQFLERVSCIAEYLSFIPMFPSYLPYCQYCISGTFTGPDSKLHAIYVSLFSIIYEQSVNQDKTWHIFSRVLRGASCGYVPHMTLMALLER